MNNVYERMAQLIMLEAGYPGEVPQSDKDEAERKALAARGIEISPKTGRRISTRAATRQRAKNRAQAQSDKPK